MNKLLLFLLLLPFGVSAQLIQKNTTYGMAFNRTGADTLFYLPVDTFAVPTAYRTYNFMARKATTLYIWNTSTFAWQAVSSGGGGSADELTGKMIYVDAVYGNNGTAQLNNLSKPYLTLAAAKAAATDGYTIIVRPGVYDGNDLLKDSVNWYFMPGAIVNAQPIYSNAMFGANSPVSCNVYGYGRFIDTLGGVSKIVELGDAGANVYIECQSMDVGYGDFDVAITVSDGKLNCLVREFIESKEYDAIIISGGTVYIQADIIRTTGATEGNAIEIAGGTSTIKCRTYTSAGAYDSGGSCAALYISGGTCNVYGDGVADLGDGVVLNSSNSGALFINGSVKSTSRTAVYYVTGTSNKPLYIQGKIISNTSYDSIDAPEAQTIVSYGAFANKVYDANITVNGVLTIGSYVQ